MRDYSKSGWERCEGSLITVIERMSQKVTVSID